MKDMSLKQQNNDTTEKDIQISDKPVAWMSPKGFVYEYHQTRPIDADIPLYTAPRELSQEEIDNVIYELRQKSFDPERWLDVYTVAIETIIQLRDELAILKKAREK